MIIYHQPPHQLLPDELLEEVLLDELDELDELEDDPLEELLDELLPPDMAPKSMYPLQCIISLLEPPQPPFWYTAVLVAWFSAWRVEPFTVM